MNEDFELEEEKSEKISISIWKKIFKIVLKSKKKAIQLIMYSFILSLLDITVPYISSKALEVFFGDNPRYELTWLFISLYAIIALLYLIIIYAFIKKAGDIEAEVSYEIRKEAFIHLQELSLSYYDKNAAGWIMARLTSDSRKLAEIVSWGVQDMVWGLATMAGILVMLYINNPILALIVTFLTPVLFIICIVLRKKILIAYRDVRKTNSQITGSFNECIQGCKTTKTLVLEDKKYDEFTDLSKSMKRQSIRAVIRTSILWPIVLVIAYIGVSFTLGIGSAAVLGVIGGISITGPVLYLFINYTTLFFDPILNISSILSELQQAQAAAERIIDLIEK